MSTRKYEVLKDGPINGSWKNQGAIVELTERGAKYLLLDGKIKPVEPKTAPKTKTAKSGK